MIRAALSLAGVLTAVAAAPPAPAAADQQVRYAAPLPLRIVRGFEAPATPYGAGHRGVDLAATAGTAVRAAAAGVISFAGSVAGRGVVVVLHADGVRTEYEPVRPAVSAGDTVGGGQVIAHVSGRHGSCAPGRCLHWGARRGTEYFDPLLLLQRLGPVRLLPWD